MTRVKRGVTSRKRHNRLLDEAKGYWGQRKNIYRRAHETVTRALAFAYKSRRLKKRDMRALFITRISAGAQTLGVSYSVLINKLSQAQILLNRKMLSQLAALDMAAFTKVVSIAQAASPQ
jgi:large subunit ribosomal protein L20